MSTTGGWIAPDSEDSAASGRKPDNDRNSELAVDPTGDVLDRSLPMVPGVVLEEVIGRGGFATVYRAHQTSVDRKVAVKVDDRRLLDERDRRRYTRETTAAGRVSAHPNIVTLYDAGTTGDGRPYLVMELCPGGSYSGRMRRMGPIDPAEVLDTGIAVADALAAAHADGILHRDVKPGNILLTRYGTAALADFGLAALPRPDDEPSVTLESLTPLYAPPEAFELRPPSEAGDIYSLGATLYGMLQGRPPHTDADGATPSLTRLLLMLNDPLPALDLPATDLLLPVIWRATELDPERRFASMGEFRDALAAARSGLLPIARSGLVSADTIEPARGIAGTPSGSLTGDLLGSPTGSGGQALGRSPSGTLPMPAGRRRWLPVAAGALVLAVMTVAAVWLLGGRGTKDPQNAVGSGSGASVVTGSGQAAKPATPAESPGESAEQNSSRDSAPASSADSVPTAEQPPEPGICFGGMITRNVERTAAELACSGPHYFESFATGVVAQDVRAPYLDLYEADPAVRRACTEANLRQYLGPEVTGTFEIHVLPTDQYAFIAGSRGFHCLASSPEDGSVRGSLRDRK